MTTKIAKKKCLNCGAKNAVTTCFSEGMASYFVGTWCECGHIQRYSNYLPDRDMANLFLKTGAWKQG